MATLNINPVNFKFSQYLSQGWALYKNNFGNILLASLLTFVMAFIPFCAMLAVGNLYKYLRKLHKGQNAEVSEIFNFDDFLPYFFLQLILFGIFFILYIPGIVFWVWAITSLGKTDVPSLPYTLFYYAYVFLIAIIIMLISVKIFYSPMLISFLQVKDIKTALKASFIMTRGAFFQILGFSLVVGLLASIGYFACLVGLIFTLPFTYACNYFAFEDAVEQISYDEISEIGSYDDAH